MNEFKQRIADAVKKDTKENITEKEKRNKAIDNARKNASHDAFESPFLDNYFDEH